MSRKEGGKIFGSGSRTPIAITFLVKKPEAVPAPAQIYYHDIGDYLTREEKLNTVKKFGTIESLENHWQLLQPNEHGDWLNQRDESFGNWIPIEPEKKFDLKTQAFFTTYAVAVNSGRDAWAYNFSRNIIEKNMKLMIDFYNEQVSQFKIENLKNRNLVVEEFINTNPKKISWTRSLRNDVKKGVEHKFSHNHIILSIYRPFCKQILYFDKPFIEAMGLSPQFFPNESTDNRVICISPSQNDGLSLLITNKIANLHLNGDTQCFPLYYYEERAKSAPSLFDVAGEPEHIRRDGVSDFILAQARSRYGERVTKEDIFYYVYGFLHSPDYRMRFSADLKKMLPRLPLVESPKDFWAFSKAGRELADLHLYYDDFSKAPTAQAIGVQVLIANSPIPDPNSPIPNSPIPDPNSPIPNPNSPIPNPNSPHLYRVEKMKFPSKDDKSRILYNSQITIENIPAAAYDYVVNGKSAIEWVMERYAVTTHKESGIRNDPNDWAEEAGNPRYILDLLLSVIRLSVETVDIVKGLPGGVEEAVVGPF